MADAAAKGLKVICSLLLDEMAIKKQIQYDGKRTWGYVDIGVDSDIHNIEPASEAVVFMVVSVNASWKLSIAYFLIKGLTGAEKAKQVNEALCRLNDIGVEVISVTCDGPSAHFTMFKELGCQINNFENLQTYFPHPNNANKAVFAFFDTCHMLKLVRNCLGSSPQVLVDPNGDKIKWAYIEELFKIQEEETLSLANKLGKKHMAWQKLKIKVN